jgi:hypothetical protein
MAADSRLVPFALDLEDFHSGEHDESTVGKVSRTLVAEIEGRLLRRAAFLTAGSSGIADAYSETYGSRPIIVNNTFPLPPEPPTLKESIAQALRLYWFSQTIGAGRGIEDVVRALGVAAIPAELHLRGKPSNGYIAGLKSLAEKVAPEVTVFVHKPSPPDDMVRLASDFEIGLAVEETQNLNKRICLSNKAFTYLLAGLAVVFTDTPGQRPLALDLGQGALMYQPGDVRTLAAGLRRWAADRSLLMQARHAAWEAARRRWHWEHPADRGALLKATAKVLQ